MADVIVLDAIEESEEYLAGKIDNVKTSVDKLPESIDNKLTPVQQDMKQLVADVQAQVKEMQKTVENSPSGVPAPSLAAFSAVSTADGISVTLTANDSTVESNNAKNVLAVTKGVMVRYSDVSYPKNKEDGALAFVDEDLFDVNTSGTRVAKAKTHTVTGLTMNSTYYFSAFPYSTGLAYNEQLGTSNVDVCSWTGIKGNLTVNVTTNYTEIPLEQHSISLKPLSGEVVTKQQTGTGSVVFSGVDGGVYTLSFTYSGVFHKPADQQVTVVGGHTKMVSAQFDIGSNFSSASWEEINRISTLGIADKLYSVGDTKDITVDGETVTLQIYGFNHDPLNGGSGNAGITIGSKYTLKQSRSMNSSSTNVGGFAGSNMYTWLNGNFYNSLPDDLKAVIKSVNKKTLAGTPSNNIETNDMKVFFFSEIEVSGTGENEGAKYPIFTNDASRIKKYNNDEGVPTDWWLRTPIGNTAFRYVSTRGKTNNGYSAVDAHNMCIGFCI